MSLLQLLRWRETALQLPYMTSATTFHLVSISSLGIACLTASKVGGLNRRLIKSGYAAFKGPQKKRPRARTVFETSPKARLGPELRNA